MNKNDKRFQRTERRIREVFTELCREKGFGKVTVTEICQKAGVNRGTFYLHYETVEELMDVVQNENIENLLGASKLYQYDQSTDAMVDMMFDLIREHKEEFWFYLFQSNESGQEKMESHLWERTLPIWLENSDLTEYEAKLAFQFIMKGGMAILREWYDHDFRDVDRTKIIFSEMIKHGLYSKVYLK